MCAVYRWHPRMEASMDGPVVDDDLLHLQQSDLDGACGIFCAIMVLLLFGIVKREDLEDIAGSPKKRLRKLWECSRRCYFIGSRPGQLRSMLTPYRDRVSCAIYKRRCIGHALETLEEGGVCIVGIHNDDLNHWVLAVGTGGQQDGDSYQPDRLLILDPSFPSLPLLPWNGLLLMKHNSHHRHGYLTIDGQDKVRVDAVVALKPKGLEPDLKI